MNNRQLIGYVQLKNRILRVSRIINDWSGTFYSIRSLRAFDHLSNKRATIIDHSFREQIFQNSWKSFKNNTTGSQATKNPWNSDSTTSSIGREYSIHLYGQRKLDGQARAATTVTNIAFDTRVIEFFRSMAILETDWSTVPEMYIPKYLCKGLHCLYIYINIDESLNSRSFRLLMSDLDRELNYGAHASVQLD